MLLFHHLNGSESLRDTHTSFTSSTDLKEVAKLPKGVSLSQFSRSNNGRDYQFLSKLFSVLLGEVRKAHGSWLPELPRKLQIIDATFIALSLKLCPWARPEGSGHEPGVKVQVSFDLNKGVPERFVISQKYGNDRQDLPQLLKLAELIGITLIFDLGYYSHRWFDELIGKGVHFITRLNSQARYEVFKEFHLSLDCMRYGILADQLVRLGTKGNKSKMKHVVRLITFRRDDGTIMRFISDRFDLKAWEVAEVYRLRWQIELFFRFIKNQMRLGKPLGCSENAVNLTVLSGCIAYILVRLVQLKTNSRQSFIDVFRVCKTAMYEWRGEGEEQLQFAFQPRGP
jgi:hypothetical protein